jgi:hypothetical protein
LVEVCADVISWVQPRLTGWPADDPAKQAGRRVEPPHIAAPQQVRTAHDAKARFLESRIEKADAWEKGED